MMQRKQYAVIGLGQFGAPVARALSNHHQEVLGIDSCEARVHAIMGEINHAVVADAMDENALKALGLRNFDAVIVSLGEQTQASILLTVILKEMGVPKVIVKAHSDVHGRVLDKVGADWVVYPERDMAIRLAQRLATPGVMDHIDLSPDYAVVEMIAPQQFNQQTLGKLNLRAKYGVTVLAIKHGDQIKVSPGADTPIGEGDILVVLGDKHGLDRFNRIIS